ncbi:Lrp/AsnC family transcriptional regulator [Tissierella praeacuta]|uniref:Lrp/AsnC family transcriptional regulator n=1 Tax=Tissierella praeacuta TaxID=43131 RepID=UPI00333E3420
MYQVDEIDIKILEILKEDARTSYSKIAELVHLSRVAVRDRILRMQEEEVILGFTVQINSKAFNKEVSVFFDIEIDPNQITNVVQKLILQEDIAIISQHTGNVGLHVHAYIDKLENLSEFMYEKLYSIRGVKNVMSHVLIKNYKTNAYLC